MLRKQVTAGTCQNSGREATVCGLLATRTADAEARIVTVKSRSEMAVTGRRDRNWPPVVVDEPDTSPGFDFADPGDRDLEEG